MQVNRGPRSGRPARRRAAAFFIQEHHAPHPHYELQLEIDGAFRTWMIPMVPTLDPSLKRMAIEAEGGDASGEEQASLWDEGTFRVSGGDSREALKKGRLSFELWGAKLKGAFALVRMRSRAGGERRAWLLIKKKDEYALGGVDRQGPARHPRPRRRLERDSRRETRPASFAAVPAEAPAVTHPEKVLFPGLGATKGEVFEYYRAIAPELLPFLKDRPVTLERLPEGLTGPGAPHFWQKNTPPYYPDWIPRATLPSGRGKAVEYVLVNNVETLLYLVNQGTLTFHAGFSRLPEFAHPDFVLFDLDPGEASFMTVVRVARALLRLLKARGLKPLIKTSGKSGLHLLVPWRGEGGFDEARAWALAVAEEVVALRPSSATTARRKDRRGSRVYIDVVQNAEGHHAVPPYVLRAVPDATVSMPIAEEELDSHLRPGLFDLRSALKRLRTPAGRALARRAAELATARPAAPSEAARVRDRTLRRAPRGKAA